MHPITDLHCDLLLYLGKVPGASIHATENIGVTLPYLRAGNVRHQVMAVFTRTEAGSTAWLQPQLDAFSALAALSEFTILADKAAVDDLPNHSAIGMTLAIENASAIGEEDEPLDRAFERLDHCLATGQHLFYLTLTHHLENRFGGGNYTDIGLKPDGEALLEWMAANHVPLDLSHTSDALAFESLTYIDRRNLSLPVLASHSNFRHLRDHPRNLPQELVQEIIRRDGLIGANFLRLFLGGERSESLLEHISYGLEQAPQQMAFGADFFWRPGISAPERQPLFFSEYADAGQYPTILKQLRERTFTERQLAALAHGNARRFIRQNW
ncbi:MAG: membrane dipeptidase [Bacteroidota bacterium]